MDMPSSFTPHDSAFQNTSTSSHSPDIFARLPMDLRHLVLQHLTSRDIASLR
jgi:hypothetical protein